MTARDILPALYAGCDGLIELRALPNRAQCFAALDAYDVHRAFATRNRGQNLYWGIATRRNADNGTEANCQHLGALFVDLDFAKTNEANARARLDAMPLPPSILNHSGHGLHSYWLLKEPLDVQTDQPRIWLQRLAAYLDADPACTEPARVLRVPGSRNFKYTPARPVVVESFDPTRRYNLTDFDAWLPAVEAETPAAPVLTSDGPILTGKRNESLYRLARSLRAKHVEPAAITTAVQTVNQTQCHPPLPEREVASIIRQALRQADRPDYSHGGDPATPVIVRLSDVTPETIEWGWYRRLAIGKNTIIAGDPGTGKSALSIDCAARFTRGAEWPDGGRAPAGAVLFLCAEDGIADTVRPRIDQHGGDPDHVYVLDGVQDANGRRVLNLARDLAAVEQAIVQVSPRLVVIDPISAYLGRTDSYKDAEVRGLLAPLLAMLERRRCALLTIAHLSKDQQRAALHRPGGSIAFVAAARLAFAVAADPQDDSRRILAPLKANICAMAPCLAFRLPDGRVEWDAAPVLLDADALLRPMSTEDRDEQTDGETFLREFLVDGPQASADVLKAAESNGISRRTLFRLKARIGVRATRVGGVGAAGRWAWSLTVPPEPARVPVLERGTLSTLSTLRPISVPSTTKSANSLALVQDGTVQDGTVSDADDDLDHF